MLGLVDQLIAGRGRAPAHGWLTREDILLLVYCAAAMWAAAGAVTLVMKLAGS